ncbi:MAG: nitrous oxide reductase family maturation protein NosD [Candidatus Thorarchaeota archaeon]
MKVDKFLFLFCVLFLISIASPVGYTEDDYQSNIMTRDSFELSYVEHSRIVITNDTDFAYQASIEDWDGTGSSDTPYIIEGYNITDDLSCIEITDVSVHFIIRNCFVNSTTGPWDPGIYFYNASHARVEDTFITWHTYGIYAHLCPDVVIDNCTVTLSNAMTIWFIDSDRAVLSDCKVYDNGYRINIESSDNVTIQNNEIHDNGWAGLRLSYSDFPTITGNTIGGNGEGGIYLEYCKNATISSNNVSRNGDYESVYITSCNYTKLVNNEIHQSMASGALFSESHYGYILANKISRCASYGIELLSCEALEIRNNDVWENGEGNHAGVYIEVAEDLFIEGNRIWNNSRSGIWIYGGALSTIISNQIHSNTHYGILSSFSTLSPVNGISVIDNQIYSNGWNLNPYFFNTAGIHAYGTNWWIEDNTVWNNTEYGVWSEGDNNTVIRNRIWDNNNSGIGVSECDDNIITENTVFENKHGIELATNGTDVTRNIVYDNDIGIYAFYIGYCYMFENDIGWNALNAIQLYSEDKTLWHDNESIGNWWSDYGGAGSYEITNGTHIVNYDLYPSKSLDLNASSSIDYEVGDTGNIMLWPAQALNPSHYEVYANDSLLYDEVWDGDHIETTLDGLLDAGAHDIMVIAYHVSGHSLNATATAEVTDSTGPAWVTAPSNQEITVGDSFSYQVTATDPSGVEGYSVNDTMNFQISSSGLITNVVDLEVGVYGLEITAIDSFGNDVTATITVTVVAAPPTGDGTTMLLLAAGAGGVVLLIFVVIFMKKRE